MSVAALVGQRRLGGGTRLPTGFRCRPRSASSAPSGSAFDDRREHSGGIFECGASRAALMRCVLEVDASSANVVVGAGGDARIGAVAAVWAAVLIFAGVALFPHLANLGPWFSACASSSGPLAGVDQNSLRTGSRSCSDPSGK
jgi:hypothetical protein